MWKTSLVVLAVLAAGCGGSANGGEPAPDFRAAVHAAYEAVPDTAVEAPTAHPGGSLRAWAAFRGKVTKASAPDALVGAKQQLLRDIETVISAIQQSTGLIDYQEIGAADSAAGEAVAAVRGDVSGL